METIIDWKKNKHTLKAIYKKLDNSPKIRHSYINGNLWIFSIGNLYTCEKIAEKNREKKYEKLTKLRFFNTIFFANVPKYDYKNIINSLY